MKKVLTLCLVTMDGKVLLGMKKRGFGAGRWNGFGGKVEEGETIEEAAKRETQEECGIIIKTMEKVGIHEFEFDTRREEMKPEWFLFADIPYETMWPDDIHWFPLFLQGKKFRTKFLFGERDSVLKKDIQER